MFQLNAYSSYTEGDMQREREMDIDGKTYRLVSDIHWSQLDRDNIVSVESIVLENEQRERRAIQY
jgi:hypothetical protein